MESRQKSKSMLMQILVAKDLLSRSSSSSAATGVKQRPQAQGGYSLGAT